jgi:hypothetical protein
VIWRIQILRCDLANIYIYIYIVSRRRSFYKLAELVRPTREKGCVGLLNCVWVVHK